MAMELRQQLKMTQQLVMTPQLQMAIKLLQLSHLELLDAIQEEMEQNSALEEGDEPDDGSAQEPLRADEALAGEAAAPEEGVVAQEKANEEIDWSNYLDEYNTPHQGASNLETEQRETPQFESFIAGRQSLCDHILWQVMLRFADTGSQRVGEMIAGNLNKDGYLEAGIDELAQTCEKPPEFVESVLKVMQTFDPAGVCARNLSECLLIQVEQLGIDDPVVRAIITGHMKNLENKNYKAIARDLKVPQDTVILAVRVIMELEPRPGRAFSQEEPRYISPDIFVQKVGDDFEIILNDDGLPKLRVSRFYKEALIRGRREMSEETRSYVQGKLKSAAWLIRSIHQRQRTIYRVMESIIKFQREFFESGLTHLKPMVLRDVAEDINMHESTISRVTTNKYAHTPQGIFELKFFFNSSINRVHGEAIASASVKDKIAGIIKAENPKKPFSDDKIAAMLEKDNIQIARRTVAKYRELLGILPSSKRKRIA
ncbi:MAG: RNA polymerase factor sigma-54 [Desulfatibacillaceae bacterium]|nr:RNA polymerase factor sigma-54 [Desulfatibacillaceae bacterium]